MAFKTKEQMTAYNKAYHEAHREENQARCRAYHYAHREEALTRSRAYYKAHRPSNMPVWGSEEDKKNRSNAAKKALSRPSTRKKLSDATKQSWSNPTHRIKRSVAIKKACSTPEYHTKLSKSVKLACSRPEVIARRSAANRGDFEERCIICGVHKNNERRNLSVHHVEYSKSACCDGKPVQFAALCTSCHMKTNYDRPRWEAMIHMIIDEIYGGRSYYTKSEMLVHHNEN